MIVTTFKTKNTTLLAGERYVRKIVGELKYCWCIQCHNDKRYDVEQGVCDAEDLPDDIRKKCDEHTGAFYACIW